ncbi:hypothetical protein [Polyangium sp. 6x1]|uniref:helix-turn-helix transcriptional regulator n=1 Tax=Polyangium sp. 6x1 TaxID=3042689 RepID=UPI00248272FF|nr:hypothetical protein [Polyangium sp. 6x1]MDI1444202.1 hypothetical protein [Polyangium sp. 6x1]
MTIGAAAGHSRQKRGIMVRTTKPQGPSPHDAASLFRRAAELHREQAQIAEQIAELFAGSTADGIPEPKPAPRYMTFAEFAERMGVVRETVYVWKREGLPVIQAGPRLFRVRVQEAEVWLAERPKKT